MRVVIQGQEASFHDLAARKFFGEGIEIVPAETFKAAFESLSNGSVDRAVIAIENSLFGSINEVYDLLRKYRFWISGEEYLQIGFCLIGLEGATLEQIKEVHSHPVALGECEDFLDTKLAHAERFESHDTAGAVADIKKWGDVTKAAIAGEAAAKLHGLAILAREVETNVHNYTRFIVLQREKPATNGSNKTSIIMHADDRPGALYRALGVFANNDINLTKLESRPIIGKAWHYIFYLDFEAGIKDPKTQTVLEELEAEGNQVEILGSYKAGQPVS